MSDDRTLALSQAYDLIEAGQPEAARALIAPLVADDGPEVNNPDAWWIYAHAVPDAATARAALDRVLALDPEYPGAADLLRTLQDQYPELGEITAPADLPEPVVIPLPPDTLGEPDFINRATTTPAAIPLAEGGTIRRLDKPSDPPQSPATPEPARKRNWVPIAIGAAALVLVGIGVIALLNQTQTQTQANLIQTATTIADATGTAQSAAGIAIVPTDFPTLDAQAAVTVDAPADDPAVALIGTATALAGQVVTIPATDEAVSSLLTATAVIDEATQIAAAPGETPIDPLLLTATAVVVDATGTAGGAPTEETIPPLLLTATAIVAGATSTAAAETAVIAATPTPESITAPGQLLDTVPTEEMLLELVTAEPTDEVTPEVVVTLEVTEAVTPEVIVTAEPTDEATPEVVVTLEVTEAVTPEVIVTAEPTDEATPEVVVTLEVTEAVTPEVVVTAEATPDPALGLDLETLAAVLPDTVLPADAVRVETTDLGATVIVSVCTELGGNQLRTDLNGALLEIGRQSAGISTGEAVAVELIDCETDNPLRLIAVTLEAAQRFARTGDELPFIAQWVSL